MGHRHAEEEGAVVLPVWMLEQVLETGAWDVTAEVTGWRGPTTRVERSLIIDVIRSRGMAEAARLQLDAMEGLG